MIDRARCHRHRLGVGCTIGTQQNIGHALFIGACFFWACYTVAMRKARLGRLHAAAVASLIDFLPVYFFVSGARLLEASWQDIALQAFVHSVLKAVVSLLLFGRAVSLLGASNGSAFAALCSAITALAVIPILCEWPTMGDWVAMLLISSGVYFASGGRSQLDGLGAFVASKLSTRRDRTVLRTRSL